MTSAEEYYLHHVIDAEAAEVFSDDRGNADTESSNRPKPTGVRSYVTNKYPGFLRSREDVIEEAIFHHQRPVEN